MGRFGFRRGDIVWARAIYPHSWCPALVLRTDLFGVLVSFFGSDPPPRYFLESEICSFEQNFPSMVKTVDGGKPCNAILNQALILVGRRAALSLKCPCQKPAQQGAEGKTLVGVGWECKRQVLEATNWFLPAEALSFVLGIAVSPWIEDEDLATAVTASAQIKKFLSYSSVKQKVMYRKGRKPEEDTNTIAQEVTTLGGKRQILSNRVDKILTDCLTIETNMKKSSESLHKVEARCVRLKRQIEQRDLAHPCSKLRKTKPFFSLSRAYAYLQKYGDSIRIDLFNAFPSGSQFMFNVPLIGHTSVYSQTVELHQPVTAGLSLNSQSDEPPESLDYSHSRILHMKFPKGFDLPSKEELIKKFRPYGPIDILNTKLSPYTGAAKVVFLHHSDAATAYVDAKEKALVAQLNVRFWLDPFDHKRGVNFLQPSSSAAKSCLKIPSSLQKDEKKARRVRFLTLPSSNLKSCLKVSSSIRKDTKKARRVRFIMKS